MSDTDIEVPRDHYQRPLLALIGANIDNDQATNHITETAMSAWHENKELGLKYV